MIYSLNDLISDKQKKRQTKETGRKYDVSAKVCKYDESMHAHSLFFLYLHVSMG